MPHETGFNTADNPYTESAIFKLCEEYGVPNDPMRHRDEKFYWTYQHGFGWPDDYLAPGSMTQCIIETLVGFTDVGLLRILESVRAYAYLILSSPVFAWSSIFGNMASSLTAQSTFLNNFENDVNRRVNIQEDIKRYQDTYMIASDMKLKIRSGTVRYNNKILVSDGNFSLGKNDVINSLEPATMKSHKDSNHLNQTEVTHRDSETAVTHKDLEKKLTITHEEEKIALILTLTGIFMIWYLFQYINSFHAYRISVYMSRP